jgi:hypothetical protein
MPEHPDLDAVETDAAEAEGPPLYRIRSQWASRLAPL